MGIPRLIHKSVHYSNVSVPGKRLTVKKRDEDDQGDRIEVLKQIIWSAVERHGSGLRDEIVPDLDPAHEVKRQEQEELSNHQSSQPSTISRGLIHTLQAVIPDCTSFTALSVKFGDSAKR